MFNLLAKKKKIDQEDNAGKEDIGTCKSENPYYRYKTMASLKDKLTWLFSLVQEDHDVE